MQKPIRATRKLAGGREGNSGDMAVVGLWHRGLFEGSDLDPTQAFWLVAPGSGLAKQGKRVEKQRIGPGTGQVMETTGSLSRRQPDMRHTHLGVRFWRHAAGTALNQVDEP